MVKKRGLKRGLDALISDAKAQTDSVPLDSNDAAAIADGTLKHLPVEWLQRGRYQPRRDMSSDALEELADSIRVQGVMQPIVVRPVGGANQYEIIAGERRWRASQMAGKDTIPAVIREVSDETAIAMALIENLQREDLNPMEEAIALARFKDEFELTHQQVAEAVGKSRAMVSNLLRLMTLEADVKVLLEHGDLEMGHARALLGLEQQDQVDAARLVVARGLSVRQTEELVRNYSQIKAKKPTQPVKEDPDVRKLVNNLSEKLGAKVQINQAKGGKGKLVISYSSLDELDGILAHIK